MRVLIWGSRNLTWKHLPIMRKVATHAVLEGPPPLDEWLELMSGPDSSRFAISPLPDSESLQLINGDGPPGKSRGAVGADKLALLACMERWPERRRVKWFAPEPKVKPDGAEESYSEALARRSVEMADARPERAYVLHEDLDSSRGSSITARRLTRLGIRFSYIQVSGAGAVLSVDER